MSDDEDGGFPKTGAGVGENDAATGPGTEDDAGEGLPAPSNVREASDGGKLREPAAPHNGAQNMNSGAYVSPSDQGPARSEAKASALDTPDPDRLDATTVRMEDLSVAPRGALTRRGDEGQVATSAPARHTGPDVLETHAAMHGDINLDTIEDILDVLEVMPKELEDELLENMSGSPDDLTGTNILDASMNLISRALHARLKRQAMDYREKEQLHHARQLVEDTTRCTSNQHEFTARIEFNKEQLHESQNNIQEMLHIHEDNLQEQSENENELHNYQIDLDFRRSSAIYMRKQATELCKKFKDKGGTAQNQHESTRHFEQSVRDVRHKMSNNTIMGLDDVVGDEHLGETAKALGGDEFPRLIQQKYDSAGKPLCNDIESILLNTLDALIFLLDMKEDGRQLLQGLCKKAAYSIELFCWQTTRDIITDDVIPLTDKRFAELISTMENVPDIEIEPKFISTFKTVITAYADILARLQRSIKNCVDLTRDESTLQDKMDDLQAEGCEILQKYPSKEARQAAMADYDKQMGTIQDRREKSIKSMKARENQISLLFSEHYYVRSEWSTKTISRNPLKAMDTLNISGGGEPNVEQAELFMSNIWALMTAYPKQFSVLIPVFYAMREQFTEEETIWVPPINDQADTFTNLGMNAEYQNMYFTQDRLLYDMIRVTDPVLVLSTQQVRMIKIKGQDEIQYYATQQSGIGAIFQMIYPHMCMTKDAVNLLQRQIESMAGGFISGPILTKIDAYRKILQRGKTAKIKVGYHELVRRCAMRIQNRLQAAYSITSKYIESEEPIHTYDAIGIMDVMMGQLVEMFRQYGISDNPPAEAHRASRQKYLDHDYAVYIAAHAPENGRSIQSSMKVMGTWLCQAKGCDRGVSYAIQLRIARGMQKAGDKPGMPDTILCSKCYDTLLQGASVEMKNNSVKIPDARQRALGNQISSGERKASRKSWETAGNRMQQTQAQQAVTFSPTEAIIPQDLLSGDYGYRGINDHHYITDNDTERWNDHRKMSTMQTNGAGTDYTTGLSALQEFSRAQQLSESQAAGYTADACHTCMTPHYECFDRPAGSNDVTLGRKMGQGCQLKYADFPARLRTKNDRKNMYDNVDKSRLKRNKFAASEQWAKDECMKYQQRFDRDVERGIQRSTPWAIAGRNDVIYHPDCIPGPAPGYAPWQLRIQEIPHELHDDIDCDTAVDDAWFTGEYGMHSSMLPSKKFPLSHCFFAEYIWSVRTDADDGYGTTYPLSCHAINLKVSRQQSLLRWSCDSRQDFEASLQHVTSEAKAMQIMRDVSLRSNPFYMPDEMDENDDHTHVHMDIGFPTSGGENVHVEQRACMPLQDHGTYVLRDDMDIPLKNLGGYYYNGMYVPDKHSRNAPELWHKNVETMARHYEAAVMNSIGCCGSMYFDEIQTEQPICMNVLMTNGLTYHEDTMDTIMTVVEEMGITERTRMMRNMIHLNQVPSLTMINLEYFDKYTTLNEHPGLSFESAKSMKTPIPNVQLSGTTIDEHVMRITMEILRERPEMLIGEVIYKRLESSSHEYVYMNGVYRGTITTTRNQCWKVMFTTSHKFQGEQLPGQPQWKEQIEQWLDIEEMEEQFIMEIDGNVEYLDDDTVNCSAMHHVLVHDTVGNGMAKLTTAREPMSPTAQFIAEGKNSLSTERWVTMSSAMPADIKWEQEMGKPMSKDAMERQYDELCSQINAYYMGGSPTTVRTPIFDTGSTDNLISADCDPYMVNTSKSPLSIGGFSGPDRISAGQQGTISAFMVSDQPGTTGSMVDIQVHSISAVKINADLISGPSLSLQGFGVDLPPQGPDMQNLARSDKYVDGLYKIDKHGNRVNQLPCNFERSRKRWTMTMVMSADKDTAKRVGMALQMQRQENTPANIFLAEQNFLTNNVQSMQNKLANLERDSRSVSGGNTCFHSVTHVQDTCQNMGTQLWGDRRMVNDEIYANKPVCIDPNMELLQFLEIEQHPQGVPPEMEQISAMVETALMVDSLDDLITIIGDKSESFNINAVSKTNKAGSDGKDGQGNIPHGTADEESTLAGIKQTMEPAMRRLTSMELHTLLGHMGVTKDPCDICNKVRKSGRRITKTVDPYHETRSGVVWCGDIIYFNVTSRGGYRYAAVFKDVGSDMLEQFVLAHRSDTTANFRAMIRRLRQDPRFSANMKKHGVFQHVDLDLAGEWDNRNVAFTQMLTEEGVQVAYAQPGFEGNHRAAGMAERTVQRVELAIKRIMLETSLPAPFWVEVLQAVQLLMNHIPTARNVVSRDGDTIRPIEAMSAGVVSRRYCNHVLFYYCNPGTPAYCSTPHVKGSNLVKAARVRPAIRIGQEGTMPIWMCPFTGATFRTKDYTILTLRPGENAWQLFGAKSPPVAEYFYLPPQADKAHVVIFEAPVILDKDTALPDDLQHVLRVGNGPKLEQKLVSIDKKELGLLKKDSNVHADLKSAGLQLEDNDTEGHAELDMNTLMEAPDRFVGELVYMHFPAELPPEFDLVQTGKIILTDDDKDSGEQFWRASFGEYTHDLNTEEMIMYCIDKTDGTTENPHDRLLSVKPEHLNRIKSNVMVFHDSVDNSELPTYSTTDNQTFIDVLKNVHILPDQWQAYYNWLNAEFEFGHLHKGKTKGLHFVNPWGVGSGKTMKPLSKQSRFNDGQTFPMAEGQGWERYVTGFNDRSEAAMSTSVQHSLILAASADVLMAVKLNHKLETSQLNQDDLLDEARHTCVVQELSVVKNMTFHNANEVIKASEPDGGYKYDAKNVQKAWPEAFNSKYIDPVTKKIIAPKSSVDAASREDAAMWKRAYDIEKNGLDQLNCFKYGLSLNDLRKMGYNHRPVPQLILYEAKYDPEGNFTKAKCRICIRGHRYACRPGIHFHQTFAAAPKDATVRLIQALMCGKVDMYRNAFDISQAFPQTPLKPEEMIILEYPRGMEENFDNGEKKFILLVMNLYGSPAANRYFCLARDKWIMEHFNNTRLMPGWSVKQMRYDSCLFRFDGPPVDGKRSITFACIHTDDVDTVSTKLADSLEIMRQFDLKYTVVMCDPRYMLGIRREYTVDDNGVKTVEMTQPDFIKSLVLQFQDKLPKKASAPTPINFFITRNTVPDPVESKNVLDAGFQSAVGSLLWASRRCFPECSYGVSQMCKVMSHPTYEAMDAAYHMIRYLSDRSDRGIRYSSIHSDEPRMYYDASNKTDDTSKTHYGYVLSIYAGPIIWCSRKHKHVSVQGSMQSEYMSAGQACRAVCWIRFLLDEMGLSHMIKKPTPLCGDNDPATRLLWNDIVTEGNQFFRREYHFGKECYEAGDISPLRVDTLVNDSDVFTKALNGAEMGRMVPRLCGYLKESRQLPVQPIGQHKVTSDAVGWYDAIAQRADGSFDPGSIVD